MFTHPNSSDEYESSPVLVRPADDRDIRALHGLAELDSSTVPAGPVMVAEVNGELVAALGVRDRQLIADPFVRSQRIERLLNVLADGHVARQRRPRRGLFGRYARRVYT